MISEQLKPFCQQIFRSKSRIKFRKISASAARLVGYYCMSTQAYFLQCHMVSGSCIINQQHQSTVIQDSFTNIGSPT